jgi:hypothetical protein
MHISDLSHQGAAFLLPIYCYALPKIGTNYGGHDNICQWPRKSVLISNRCCHTPLSAAMGKG